MLDQSTNTAEYQYKEYDKLLKEHFINEFNDDGMVDEILKEVVMLENIEDTTTEHVLLWAHRVGGQRGKINP